MLPYFQVWCWIHILTSQVGTHFDLPSHLSLSRAHPCPYAKISYNCKALVWLIILYNNRLTQTSQISRTLVISLKLIKGARMLPFENASKIFKTSKITYSKGYGRFLFLKTAKVAESHNIDLTNAIWQVWLLIAQTWASTLQAWN